jgi:monofunctional biosynthetic peptidoglycan transglycosylase
MEWGRLKQGPKTKLKKRKASWFALLCKAFLIMALVPIGWVLLYRFLPIPGTFLMVQRAIEGDDTRRNPIALKQISPYLVRSVIAAEDANFCAHDGFDWKAIKVAMKSNERGRKLRGGSTISQQTAKNVFLWPQRSYVRKGLEAGFTVLIEIFWTKRRIMEVYLNVAEFGPGIFGAEAGALSHFGKRAKDLTPLEAARLAAILPSPRRWSPTSPSRRVARKSSGIVAGARIVRDNGLDACIYPKTSKS